MHVTQLNYSAHPGAEAILRSVVAGVAADHDVLAVAAVHRVGNLAVGDVAVVVAASAAHREVAFLASRALIEEIKSEVPIWKEQFYADGTNTWVGTLSDPTTNIGVAGP
jgi:molybdopterin synthase catalytic subunit